MAFVPKATQPPKIQRVSNRDWLKGTVTAFDDGRTPTDGLRDSGNLVLEQDGTVRPRPSLVPYGPTPVGTILGEVYEFTRTNAGVREYWLVSMQNVSGTTKVYVAKGEDETWTECDGKEYDDTAYAHFLQFTSHEVWVMNGEDNLSYLETDDMSIVPFIALDDPVAPTLDTNTGLTGTDFKVYYAVTSNSSVGETAGSPVLEVDVLKDRDLWNPDTESITVARTPVTDEASWNLYVGVAADGAGEPKLYAIATGLDPTLTTFTDNGTRQQDLSRPLPLDNSTAGPKVTRGCLSNNRSFLVGDKEHLDFVWRSGDYGFEKDLSPANGGGYTPVGGGKELPIAAKSFRNGKGDAMVMILTQGTNGTGRRFYLNPENVSYGGQTFVVWRSTEDSGQDGTDSPDGLIIYQNSAWYPSRDGFKTTGTKPQLQNILSTDKVSNTIQDAIATLNTSAMGMTVGVAFENRLYWSLPVLSDSNSEIWVLDLERKGAWMKPWNIPADWLFLYNDNSGNTHLLALVDNALYELTYGRKTSDDGTTFFTSGQSGQVRFSEDGREWGRLIQLIYVLLRPQGEINFTVTGKGEDGELFSFMETRNFSGGSTRVGWSEPRAGWSNRGWSKVKAVPLSFNSAVEEVIIEVDEDLQWYQYGWNTTESGVDYSLSQVVSEYVNVGVKDLS